jgi:hypothetical protein
MGAHRLIRRAHKRAQRRLHVALALGVAVDGNAPETRLWTEAERLIDRLEWAEKRRRYDVWQMRDRDEVTA